MRFKNKHNSNDETFWLSATDMMAGILVVVLLLLMLFLLYLNLSKDEVYTPLDATQHPYVDETHLYDFATTAAETQPDPTQGPTGSGPEGNVYDADYKDVD